VRQELTWDPGVGAANIADSLVGEPVLLVRQSPLDSIIKVRVVSTSSAAFSQGQVMRDIRKDDMTPYVKQKPLGSGIGRGEPACY
jgi:hypothetical protein